MAERVDILPDLFFIVFGRRYSHSQNADAFRQSLLKFYDDEYKGRLDRIKLERGVVTNWFEGSAGLKKISALSTAQFLSSYLEWKINDKQSRITQGDMYDAVLEKLVSLGASGRLLEQTALDEASVSSASYDDNADAVNVLVGFGFTVDDVAAVRRRKNIVIEFLSASQAVDRADRAAKQAQAQAQFGQECKNTVVAVVLATQAVERAGGQFKLARKAFKRARLPVNTAKLIENCIPKGNASGLKLALRALIS